MFRAIGRWLSRLIILSVIVIIILVVLLLMDYQRFLKTPVVVDGNPKTLKVNKGDTLFSLLKSFGVKGSSLASHSLFSKALVGYYFRYLAKSTHKLNQLKVGEYQLTKGMTPSELLDILISGKTIAYKIRFLEGWNFKKIRTTLLNNAHIDQTLLFVPNDEIMGALKLGDGKVFYEGEFFPDTYQFSDHTKDSYVLEMAYDLMQKKLAKAWTMRDKSIELKSPYELLILASIIEKETSIDSERKKISGVFQRRLAKGMPLQTDPTVIYGMGDKYKGSIYSRDLKKDTPYNTYTRKGLPPTPIASPSMASLIAAGQPDKGKSLYFVANGKGGHTFTRTYKKHLEAVKDYRKQQKKK
ncbi:MAG: endolytic transglycosylase MltG [Ostreibacterium sp.]